MGFHAVAIQGSDATANSNGVIDVLVAATKPCRLFSVTAFNNNAATRFLQVFDATAAPVDGTAPLMAVQIPTGGTGTIYWDDGRPMKIGVVALSSTTGSLKTLGSNTDLLIDVTYRYQGGP